jgi:hypothetical protein
MQVNQKPYFRRRTGAIFVRAAACAIVVTIPVAQPFAQTAASVEPSPSMQRMAEAEALFASNPNSFEALHQMALAHLDIGENQRAAIFARRAFKLARTDAQKLEAARIAGAANFYNQQYILGKWWLRRASNFTSSVSTKEQVRQEYKEIERSHPLSIELGFSIAPSSNINGGSREEAIELGGFRFIFSPENRALSGVEYAADAKFEYTLQETNTELTEVGLYLYGRTYSMTSSSEAAAPSARGSHYALGQVDLSFGHQRYLFDGLGPTGGWLYLGQLWYGGDPLWRYARAQVTQEIPIGENATATLRYSHEDRDSLSAFQPDATVADLNGTYAYRLGNGDFVELTLGTRETDGMFTNFTFSEAYGFVEYELGDPVLNTRLTLNAGIGQKDYDEFSLSLDGRRDSYFSIGGTGVYEGISYYGFSPSLSVSATKTDSNVSRFSTTGLAVKLGLESNF